MLHWLILINLQLFAGSKEKWQKWITKANLLETSFYVGDTLNLDAKQLFICQKILQKNLQGNQTGTI